ncbi:keratin-associated protein 19-2 [Amyelois transitella]|uniref:keratin-associated protein 19-2 n=1 Tax=Amyelois transitella TaxID=680683 RepID=UPI00298FBE82|nr:keratin-associated protein 19-2 [Amyelois transitella]
MALRIFTVLVAAAGYACAAPSETSDLEKALIPKQVDQQKDDLVTDASSSYVRGYSDWGGYPSASSYSGYGVTGYGTLDDKYNNYNSYYGGYGGYDNAYGYNGYAGNSGYGGYAGNSGYGGYAGNSGYGGYAGNQGGYAGISGGYSGINGGYNDYNGYKRYGGYGLSNVAGNGGYGGYGGNGGLVSYYGYNSPYNQGAYHLGYGYYNKRTGNIYNSGVTPSLVTGYRGYSRR